MRPHCALMSSLHVQRANREQFGLWWNLRSPGFHSVTLLRGFVTFNQGFLTYKIGEGKLPFFSKREL